ncbi:N-acetylmuramoyl-L-alanine amidase [Sporosarcina sp. FSL K6-1508]|uniref:N-acetylmuramoyl-L-alanine amidase n=1 Tax=Sporosarcina sp. FSL K6-1508 TaxID=2921553 RepID=UPI0030F60D18
MTFIDQLAPYAIKHGRAQGVLPSLIIAQGILESASGTSELALKANNLFGIKSSSEWPGDIYTKRTAENKNDGTVYYIDADFRKYPTFEGCVIDLVQKYTHGTGRETSNRYEAVLNQTDYKKATAAVKASGYATDVNYPEKLNKLIEQYDLMKYDKGDGNVVKIFIDPGHGGKDPGAVGLGLQEKVLTLKISQKIRDILQNEYSEVTVKMSRTSDIYLTLSERAKLANAWGAELLLSIHINATPSGYGYEDWIYNGSVSAMTTKVQSAINAAVIKSTNWRNRGKKRGDLAVLRESKMPALLTESGFIDNPDDAKLLTDNAFLDKVARGHVNGIAEAFGLKRKTVATDIPGPSQKEDEELKFSSPSLKAETEVSLSSKARREIIVAAAIKAGAHVSWKDKLKNNTLTDADVLGLAVKYTIAVNK